MNKFNRNSHWPIDGMVPIELIKIVIDTVREAPEETIPSKDGLVVFFPSRGGDYQKWQLEKGKNE